jgi:hypothetical protein
MGARKHVGVAGGGCFVVRLSPRQPNNAHLTSVPTLRKVWPAGHYWQFAWFFMYKYTGFMKNRESIIGAELALDWK